METGKEAGKWFRILTCVGLMIASLYGSAYVLHSCSEYWWGVPTFLLMVCVGVGAYVALVFKQ